MKVVILRKKKIFLTFILLIFLSVCIFASFSPKPLATFSFAKTRKLPIYSVEKSEKVCAITFDAAWGTEFTDYLLQELKRYDVRATFFLVEFWSKKYPDFIKKIDKAGHEIGTHSSTHKYMTKLDSLQIQDELTTSSKAIFDITGKKVTLFRAPYGDYNDRLIDTAFSMGFFPIQWDVDSLDWKEYSSEEIAMRVINKVTNGSIILCHNNGKNTYKALPLIFTTLKNQGYKFVPVGELIYKDNFEIRSDGKQIVKKSI